MPKILKASGRGLLLILDDILLLGATASVTHGAFLIYRPAGWIILGLCLAGFAYLVAAGRRRC